MERYSPEEIMKEQKKTGKLGEDVLHEIAKETDDKINELISDGLNKNIQKHATDLSSLKVEKAEAVESSLIDGLTGLKNIKAFKIDFPKILSSMERENKDCSILVIDIDFFKKDNDKYGHQAGDSILKTLSKVIGETARQSDSVYRYGGEEFVVVSPGANVEDAKKIAERIRDIVDKFIFSFEDSTGKKYREKKTVSIGCFGFKQLYKWENEADFNDTVEKMVNKGDLSMYAAKKEGRNKVVIYDKSLESKKDEVQI
jgi:diguanylate cyclase (GGDEF)-like protein